MEKYFVIFNNHSLMISHNLVKALGEILYFIHYMIFCNPVKRSWQDIVFHSYMTSNNPLG